MNLFKIVRKKTDKGISKSNPYRDVGTVLLFVFLLPYVISSLWGHIGEETDNLTEGKKEKNEWIDEKYEIAISGNWGIRKMSMHEYLIRKLEIVLGQDEEESMTYEFETLKAQAILLRTELWGLILNNNERDNDKNVIIQDDTIMYGIKGKSTICEQAVENTDGIYLSYENRPVKAAFFPVSNGHTRAASEVWGSISYPYLVSVECNQDILADDYHTQVIVSKDEYCRIIPELYINAEAIENNPYNTWKNVEFSYDSAGYVVEANVDGYSLSGETFRTAFGLNSASFNAEWKDDEVIFHVTGVGHGFGMSQYGANERAFSGETFDQILKYYFFNTELAKIE
ncbi:MAG: SpoIID/LytB domain-containing protein [Lachnospiraceae bacterium]|nr:SpoIID/LytB domain-containing protein [Lachnospiraceae bacterium]